MRAQILGKCDVARLVECAGEIARLEHRAQHRGRIARIGAQITLAQVGGGKQRRAAREVEHDVAARRRAVARRAKCQFAARRWIGRGIVVHRQFEGAEIALGLPDIALHHREFGRPQRRHVAGRLDQHGDVEMLFQQIGGFDRLFVLAVNQRHAVAGQRNERDLRRRLEARRDQRRHFRAGRFGVRRPAGGLADIDEAQFGRVLDFAGDLLEQRRFLCAGHGERRPARCQFAKALELGTAKLAAFDNFRAAADARHSLASERHRVFAGTDQDVTRPFGHPADLPFRLSPHSMCERPLVASFALNSSRPRDWASRPPEGITISI